MAGEVASLLLSRMTVPIVYFLMKRGEARAAKRAASSPVAPGTSHLQATPVDSSRS
jgi:hypothetical protein